MKDKVLIVDDIELNRIILEEILKDDYDILQASNGIEAIDILYSAPILPQVVLLDIMMPEMDGFEVLELIKSNPHTEKIPVLFITAADSNTNETKGLYAGAIDYISKPFNPDVVKVRVDNHIQLMRYQHSLEALVEKKAAELMSTHERILETLATIIEYRSLESGQHVKRVSELTKLMINQLITKPKFYKYLMEQNYNSIVKASSLHDIGKVGIPDAILLKPARLEPAEFEIIKTHSTIGSDIIASMNISENKMYLKHCMDICRHHHERWDGSGYPDKLKGEEIPLSARVVSVVDVYDALVSKRCYKDGVSHEKALQIITDGSGTQFDPDMVECFVEIQNEFRTLLATLQDPE